MKHLDSAPDETLPIEASFRRIIIAIAALIAAGMMIVAAMGAL